MDVNKTVPVGFVHLTPSSSACFSFVWWLRQLNGSCRVRQQLHAWGDISVDFTSLQCWTGRIGWQSIPARPKSFLKALVTLSVKWGMLKIVTYDQLSFPFGSFMIYSMCQHSLCVSFHHTCTCAHRMHTLTVWGIFSVWAGSQGHWVCIGLKKKLFSLNETSLKGCTAFTRWDSLFSFYVQIDWRIHISTLNDHKKSQSQLGGIRRLPSGSHKGHQLRVIACFTNTRCIVVIKEALEYRLRTGSFMSCFFFFFFTSFWAIFFPHIHKHEHVKNSRELLQSNFEHRYHWYNCFPVLYNQLYPHLGQLWKPNISKQPP